MHTLSPQDLKALQDFVLISAFMLSVFGFMTLYFLYGILDRYVFKRIRLPKKIKTQYGYLFRTYSGIYVREDELDDVNDDYFFKNKERSIRLLEYRLKRLKDQHDSQDSH
ncbi:hypothetical protein [Acinetobacter bereziniae]|uniref:hypothetical protein n=1 Tax=Acinetobacter bereziniae TaxID=106648 RepID=UPI00111706E6|nr:hypothetical protein [Acinetobacter bereziniae]TNL43663.1 hypothetical protein EYB59_21745 [Acinetobacter bereziniae]TNL54218.1 hypothetical protein EYY58_18690 [Acinetobacter bereziniae]